MFETLKTAPPDAILALIAQFAADDRPGKIDLGVGVYRDEDGKTPVMAAVRQAQEAVVRSQTTKSYVGMAGNARFNRAITELVLGEGAAFERVRTVQAVGGTGALRVLAELLVKARPGATVHLSAPTWPNHRPIMVAAGLKVGEYPYFDATTKQVDHDAMLATLGGLGPNDIVVLHGCCHNPTGANLTNAQWDKTIDVLERTGAFPLVDLAYLGFGDGLEADAYAVRQIVKRLPEAAVAVSCSKNFALYRDRVGAAMLLGPDTAAADAAMSNLLGVVRANYSMPPDQGAEIVATILADPELRRIWQVELTAMRERINAIRTALADALRTRSNRNDFDFLATHRGMFSLTGISPDQVETLKKRSAIYMVGSSRINIVGLGGPEIDKFAEALTELNR
jgi:aspartate aminotransferase